MQATDQQYPFRLVYPTEWQTAEYPAELIRLVAENRAVTIERQGV